MGLLPHNQILECFRGLALHLHPPCSAFLFLSSVSCLLSSVSCLLSPVSVFCLLSSVFCLLSPVSCLLSPVSYPPRRRIAAAAFLPGAPMIPPPGCVAEPHI